MQTRRFGRTVHDSTVAILYRCINANMAITSGVHTAEDVIKCMMAGAKIAMTTSALLHDGIDRIRPILADLVEWMEKHEPKVNGIPRRV